MEARLQAKLAKHNMLNMYVHSHEWCGANSANRKPAAVEPGEAQPACSLGSAGSGASLDGVNGDPGTDQTCSVEIDIISPEGEVTTDMVSENSRAERQKMCSRDVAGCTVATSNTTGSEMGDVVDVAAGVAYVSIAPAGWGAAPRKSYLACRHGMPGQTREVASSPRQC